MRNPRTVFALFALAIVVVWPGEPTTHASAPRSLVLDVSELTRSAALVVVGVVVAARGEWDAQRRSIVTRIDFRAEEILKGDAAPGMLQIVEPGGRVGGAEAAVADAPTFSVGERAVLFLARRSDGTLRVMHLYMGKFSVEHDATLNTDVAVRRPPGSSEVLDRIPVRDIRRTVRDSAGR